VVLHRLDVSPAGWTIYPRESTRRFSALLTGGALAEEGPDGRKPL
jgi:hypothetical protein